MSLFFCLKLNGQEKYSSKNDYLVDSLDLTSISKRDKLLIDSALSLYNQCPTDTCRIKSVSLIVEGSWDENVWPKYNLWVLQYVQERLIKQQSDDVIQQLKKYYAGAINNIGYFYNSKGQTDSALIYYDRCLKIQKEIGDKPGMSGTLINSGYIFLNQGLIQKALDSYYGSLRIEEEINNQSGVATALNAIGYIQYQQGDDGKALKNYERSLVIRESLDEKYGMATCLNNIGLVYKDQKQWNKALEFYHRGLKIENELGDKNGMAISLNNIGFIYSSIGQLDKAIEYYSESLEILETLQDKMRISQCLNSIASAMLTKGELKKARSAANKSLKLAKELNYPAHIRDAAQVLSDIAKKEENWRAAITFLELYIQMRDSVFNEETINASIHQQYKYNYEKKFLADSIENANLQKIKTAELAASEAEKERLSLLAAKQKEESYFLIIVIFIVLLFMTIIYNRMKAINRHKNIIEEQKEELEYLNKDLEEFAHIVSHDLKTPLHNISGLLSLIEDDFPSLEKDLIEKLKLIKQSSLESNALIDGVLSYSEAGKKAVDVTQVDIKKLVNSMTGHLANPKGVRIKVITDLPTITCNEYQFYQILSNLLGNAIKYNDKKKNEGEITITCSQIPGFHVFEIADNGPGIPEALQPKVFEMFQKGSTDQKVDSTGIGLSIVKKLVTKNEGTIELISEEGKGATFRFTWPL